MEKSLVEGAQWPSGLFFGCSSGIPHRLLDSRKRPLLHAITSDPGADCRQLSDPVAYRPTLQTQQSEGLRHHSGISRWELASGELAWMWTATATNAVHTLAGGDTRARLVLDTEQTPTPQQSSSEAGADLASHLKGTPVEKTGETPQGGLSDRRGRPSPRACYRTRAYRHALAQSRCIQCNIRPSCRTGGNT